MKKFLVPVAALFLTPILVFAQGQIAGKWTGEQQGRGGAQPVTLELKVEGSTVTGTLKTGDNTAQISDGKLDGTKVSFKTTQNRRGNNVQINWSGEVKGDELTLTREGGGGGGGRRGGGGGGGRGGGARTLTLKRSN
jgi:hypothetical protein